MKEIKNFGKIISQGEEILKFKSLFQDIFEEYKNKKIDLELIYDANKDGQNYSNCHSKCNNVPNTISFVTTNKGNKFGFFRSIPINGDGPWRTDNKAFFISFDKNKIYKIKNNKNSVAFDNTCFIQTLCFTLTGNILIDKYNSSSKDSMNNYFEGFVEDYELTGKEKEFCVKKFEVYKINN